MAMTKCTECKSDISDKAIACPSCGAKPPKKTTRVTKLVAGLIALVVGIAVLSPKSPERPQPKVIKLTPEEVAEKDKRDKNIQFALSAARLLKAVTKDPSSFELIHAMVIDGGAVCITYRGKNSYGAIVVNETAMTRAMAPGDWNKHCGGKRGTDVSSISAVM